MGNAPPAGWRYFEGHELVVRGTGGSGARPSTGSGRAAGRRVQIGRARVRQWTARAEARFLAVLRATGNVHAAAAEVALCLSSAYNHAQRWPGFAEAWRAAAGDGYESLEAALALEGRNLFAGASGADDEAEPAPQLRIVGMTAEHALACLNAYRKLVPIDRYPAAVQEADAAAKAATEERLWRKLALLAQAQAPAAGRRRRMMRIVFQ